jgi:hypothetical protein
VPDRAAEEADPQLADEYYETAIQVLIERTRDRKQFERVFDENCQYGFRRNLWGCRSIGIWLAATGLTVTAGLGALDAAGLLRVSILGLVLSGIMDLILLVVLIVKVRSEWVREQGNAYAERLLASLEVL